MVCKERATTPAGLRAAARRGAAPGGHLRCCPRLDDVPRHRLRRGRLASARPALAPKCIGYSTTDPKPASWYSSVAPVAPECHGVVLLIRPAATEAQKTGCPGKANFFREWDLSGAPAGRRGEDFAWRISCLPTAQEAQKSCFVTCKEPKETGMRLFTNPAQRLWRILLQRLPRLA